MSLPSKINISCPFCRQSFAATMWNSINTDFSDNVADEIISGKFFDINCPHCGKTVHTNYDILYHDMNHHAMIWLLHSHEPNYIEHRKEIRKTAIISGYKTRLVNSVSQLREKVAALEAGRDDRVIELCKVHLLSEMCRSSNELDFKNVFYTILDGQERFLMYDSNDQMFAYVEFSEEIYDKMWSMFFNSSPNIKDGPYPIYDKDWAQVLYDEFYCEEQDVVAEESDADIEPKESNISGIFDSLDNTVFDKDVNLFIDSPIRNNPFYVLNVNCQDNRRTIISVCEEMAFGGEADIYEEAKNILLNPQKRLIAELDWFCDADTNTISIIRKKINSNASIDNLNLSVIDEINAKTYNFCINQHTDLYAIGYDILNIDLLYNRFDTYEIMESINEHRTKSGVREVTEVEVSEALTGKRDQIRKIISEKLQKLPDKEYVVLVNAIADNYVANSDFEYGVVVSDIIDQYEIKFQAEIERHSSEILTHIDRIKRLSKEEAVKENLPRLIRRIKKWRKVVNPLYVRSIVSGLEHSGIDKITHNARELVIFLHNQKEWTESAYELTVELKKLFNMSGEMSDRLENDENTLREILDDAKANSALLAKLNEFADTAEYIIDNVCVDRVDSFVDALVEINREIKGEDLGEELTYKLRERIFYIARGVILALHNDHRRTSHSVRIATALKLHFKDIDSLEKVASDDLAALTSNLNGGSNYAPPLKVPVSSKTRPIGCFFVIVAVLAILMLIGTGLSTCDNTGSSNSSSASKPSYNNSSSSNSSGSSNSSNSSSNNSSGSSSTTTSATVSLDKQGGSGGTSSITVKDSSSMPSATQPTKEGYIFDGYYAEKGGLGTKYYDANMKSVRSWYSSGPKTLYAYWIKDPDNINKKGVTITKDNFENYFTIETEAELVGSNQIIIKYSITPKSNSYAKDADSSKTIYVEIGAEASMLAMYFGEPSYDIRECVTLSKSNNYTASGEISFKHYVYGETVYWFADIAYCSGSIGY